MPPATYHFTIYQGDTHREKFWLSDENDKPIDLSGYSATFTVRASTVSDVDELELTNGSGITIPNQTGTYQGEWASGTSYSTDDIVLHKQTYWIATTNTSTEPSTSNSDWDLSPLGRVDVAISSTQSNNLTCGQHNYDLEMTASNGDVETWVAGTLTVDRDIS